MPSRVARVKNPCSSSVVSKVFRLLVHLLDEVLVVFDVEIHDILISVRPRAFEIVLQRRVRTVARHREEHVVDAISAQGLEAVLIAKVSAELDIVVLVAFEQAVRDKCQ